MKIRFTSLLPVAMVCAIPAITSCGKTSTTTAESGSAAVAAESEQTAPAHSTPAIDKSSDATLQTMIKEVAPRFTQATYTDTESGKTVKYNLFAPKTVEAGKKYPLVVFIADASTVGSDATTPLTQGYGALVWATDEWQAKNPCYVLVPQFEDVAVNDAYDHTPAVDAAARLVRKVAADNQVDTDRIYSTGQSMGGMIAMYYDVAYPDLFAASIFVDSHWDTATFDKLVKHKFIYFIAGDNGKAYADMKPMEEAAEKEGVNYVWSSWSAKLPIDRQNELAATMLGKGAPVNIFQFEQGTVVPEGIDAPDHMYSFDYAYRIPAVRDWLFGQKR
ncbi:MAG: prolyl oligopeptidase family serine peptidase [Muribaculaceae bacterium]|nr:prolyl oligopeptidase family serine peptidase [Muribaculaceae bacterium]